MNLASALTGIASTAAAALLAVGIAWTGWVVTARILPRTAPSRRLAGVTIIAYAIAYLLFLLLIALHMFRLPVAVAAVTVLALASHAGLARDGSAWRLLRSDAAHACDLARRSIRSPWGLAAASVATIGAVRVARGLVLPPMGWDALVYHLTKAARWVQLGRNEFIAAPDAWGQYEHYPAAGSVFWAWALLPARDGAFLALAGGIVWGTVLIAGYAAARRFGAQRVTALAAAAALGTCPAVASLITASYVDTTMLALFTLALVFWGGAGDGKGGREAAALLAGLALGLGAAVKASLLPVVAVALAIETVRASVARETRSRRVRAWSLFAAPALILFATAYGGTWIRTGSPFYPLALTLAGRTIVHGNESLASFLAGRTPLFDPAAFPWYTALKWMFLPLRAPRSDFASLGPGAPLLAALAIPGALAAVRERSRRAGLLLAATAAVVFAMETFSPEVVALRTVWASVFSRHVTPLLAVATVLAAVVPARRAWPVWIAALGPAWWLALPRGWGHADVHALAKLGPAALAGLAAAAVGIAAARRWRSAPAATAALALAVVPVAALLPSVRAAARYPIYRSALATEGGAYDFHSLDDEELVAWPVWKRLDEDPPSRVAVTCGWGEDPQVWYLYPLMGSRLQNELLYVPPTIDGSVVDYRNIEELNRKAQLRAWLQRLVDERVDRVVTIHPSSPERLAWIVRLPGVFVLEEGNEAWDTFLYRFDRDAARRLLAKP